MGNQTAPRGKPEGRRAQEASRPVETEKELRTIIENALKQSSGKFLPELQAAVKAEKDASVHFDGAGEPALTGPRRCCYSRQPGLGRGAGRGSRSEPKKAWRTWRRRWPGRATSSPNA